MTREIRLRAPAKINLGLDVLTRRPDGFHDLRTIFQSIDLADDLVLHEAAEITVLCDDPDLAGPDNLCSRAVDLLRRRTGTEQGAAITLTKRIPVAAGLGGGSSDAAATLAGLNELWGLGLSRSDLSDLAGELGSDVPFFLSGGTRLATGRGEILEKLPALPATWVVLALPPLEIPGKTAALYRQLAEADKRPSDAFDQVLTAVRSGRLPDPAHIVNSFRSVYDREYPQFADCVARCAALAGRSPHLSGAGPSVYWLLPDETAAGRLAGTLASLEIPVWAVPTCDRSPLRCP